MPWCWKPYHTSGQCFHIGLLNALLTHHLPNQGHAPKRGRTDWSDPSQHNSQPKTQFRIPCPATMYLGTYVCGYLSGMRVSAKVILMLTDTSVYSGRISLESSSSRSGPETSGMYYWTIHSTLVFWVGIPIVNSKETSRETFPPLSCCCCCC